MLKLVRVRISAFVAWCVLTFISNFAIAAVINMSGNVALLQTPYLEYSSQTAYTASASITDATSATVFAERSGFSVPSFSNGNLLQYEAAVSGRFFGLAPVREFATGALLNSYILHFGIPGLASRATGSVTFDHDILGFMTHFGERPIVESEFQLPGIDLVNASGLELFTFDDLSTLDTVSVSVDLRTITFDFNVNGASDDLRIFTTVPEPSTLLLIIAGALLLMRLTALRKKFVRRSKCLRSCRQHAA